MDGVVARSQFTTCAQLPEYVFIIEKIMKQQQSHVATEHWVNLDDKQLFILQGIKV
jgi:hypothetical protein